MPTLKTFDNQLHGPVIPCRSRLRLILERDVGIHAAGAAYIQLALLLGIEVKQDVTVQHPFLQAERTVHTRLLGRCEKRFERTVFERIVLQDGKNSRRTDTVVRTERRTVGRHPFAVDIRLDRVLGKVELLIVVLLGNHIQMRLQNDTLAVLHPFGGRLADIDIVGRILLALQAETLGYADHVRTDLLLVGGRTGYFSDFCKMLPNQRGFQSGQILIHSSSFLLQSK